MVAAVLVLASPCWKSFNNFILMPSTVHFTKHVLLHGHVLLHSHVLLHGQ